MTTKTTKTIWLTLVILTLVYGFSLKEEPIKREVKEPKIIYTWDVDDNMIQHGVLTDSCKITSDYNYLLKMAKKRGLIQGWIGYKIENMDNYSGWTCVYINPGIDSDSLKQAIDLVIN